MWPLTITTCSGRSEPRTSATTFREGAGGSVRAPMVSRTVTFWPRACMRWSIIASSTLTAAAGMRRVLSP